MRERPPRIPWRFLATRGSTGAARCAAALLVFFLTGVVPAAAQEQPGLPSPRSPLELSTPRSALTEYFDATRRGDFSHAAHVLDLGSIPRDERAERGRELARQLYVVLGRQLWVEPNALPDDPKGHGSGAVELGQLRLGGVRIAISLGRSSLDGDPVWRFTRRTVEHVPELYDRYGPTWIESRLPSVFRQLSFGGLALWQWLGLVIGGLAAWLLAVGVTWILLRVGWKIAAKTDVTWDDRLLTILQGPSRLFLALLLTWATVELLRLPVFAQHVAHRGLQVLLTVGIAWFGMRLTGLVADLVEERAMQAAEAEADSIKARGVRTQMNVLRRIVSIVISILAVAVILLQFEAVRTVGMSMLASAGIVGVVVGVAAQRSLGSLISGVQLSITQPVRIGDTVIIDGNWGTIEEITLTYVVLRIWDQRRLVVPMSRLLDQSFENWTKVSPDLLGTVFLYVDYRLPVQDVRDELDRVLEGHPLWDGKGKSVLVTGATEQTMEIRLMLSAANANDLWSLRCEVREKMIEWFQRYDDGRYLPRARLELDRAVGTQHRDGER